jgi:hypothetical protein
MQRIGVRLSSPGLLQYSAIVSGCALLLTTSLCALSQTNSIAAQQVMNELPACSVLREQIEHGTDSHGIQKPYMEAMRGQGVKRAFFEIDSVWRGGKPTELQFVHRLYFAQFDAANSQIVDSARLAQIKGSGLEADHENVARERVRNAPLFAGVDLRTNPDGKRMYSYVELLADPWLPEPMAFVSPIGKFPPVLVHSAMIGDLIAVASELKNKQISRRELNRALFEAVGNLYDNTAVIRTLINAGADVNVHGPDGFTPLMMAVARPCNVRPLLNAGADVSARDKWGRDALQLSREVKQPISIRLLQGAAADPQH